MAEELNTDLVKAQYLQNLLIDYSTGRGGEDADYMRLRTLFVSNPSTKNLIPNWVIKNRDLSQFWQFIKFKFSSYQERREFIYAEFNPLLEYLEFREKNPNEQSITKTLEKFDPEGIHVTWAKALERKSRDPDGAITIARTLLESTCKYILDERGVDYDSEKIKLQELYKKIAEELNLAPEQHQESIFKQILGGCSSVVNGLGSLRNKLGDAHGSGKNRVKPKERHAELAVNLAGSMALFLIETHKESLAK
jgi:hypothetical protein